MARVDSKVVERIGMVLLAALIILFIVGYIDLKRDLRSIEPTDLTVIEERVRELEENLLTSGNIDSWKGELRRDILLDVRREIPDMRDVRLEIVELIERVDDNEDDIKRNKRDINDLEDEI